MTPERAQLRRVDPVPARVLALALAGALAVAVVVPSGRIESGPIICPFRLLTGLPCPVCGLTRAWVFLAHGQVGEAFAAHPMGPVTVLAAVVTIGWIVRTRGVARFPSWLRRGLLVVVLTTVLVGAVRLVVELA